MHVNHASHALLKIQYVHAPFSLCILVKIAKTHVTNFIHFWNSFNTILHIHMNIRGLLIGNLRIPYRYMLLINNQKIIINYYLSHLLLFIRLSW
jgi:hypothetical protein